MTEEDLGKKYLDAVTAPIQLSLEDQERVAALLEPWWRKEGYLAGKEIHDGLWIVFGEMITTWRISICDPGSVHEFWCYPKGSYPIDSYVKAWEIWDDFNGVGDPRPGWVKHFPSMRRNEPIKY